MAGRLYNIHANHTPNSGFDRTFMPFFGVFLIAAEQRVGYQITCTGSLMFLSCVMIYSAKQTEANLYGYNVPIARKQTVQANLICTQSRRQLRIVLRSVAYIVYNFHANHTSIPGLVNHKNVCIKVVLKKLTVNANKSKHPSLAKRAGGLHTSKRISVIHPHHIELKVIRAPSCDGHDKQISYP